MSAVKDRRERLFRGGKPIIRAAEYDDIRWLWAAARRAGFDRTSEEFTEVAEQLLAGADKIFILEDRYKEFASRENSVGPVGVVLANYDGWSILPHVEWFPWATKRNILRCTVGFLQSMKYTHGVGSIKIFSDEANARWFKWLKRYVAISFVGKIPGGRNTGEEYIFYMRGRKQGDRHNRHVVRRQQREIPDYSNTQTAANTT